MASFAGLCSALVISSCFPKSFPLFSLSVPGAKNDIDAHGLNSQTFLAITEVFDRTDVILVYLGPDDPWHATNREMSCLQG